MSGKMLYTEDELLLIREQENNGSSLQNNVCTVP